MNRTRMYNNVKFNSKSFCLTFANKTIPFSMPSCYPCLAHCTILFTLICPLPSSQYMSVCLPIRLLSHRSCQAIIYTIVVQVELFESLNRYSPYRLRPSLFSIPHQYPYTHNHHNKPIEMVHFNCSVLIRCSCGLRLNNSIQSVVVSQTIMEYSQPTVFFGFTDFLLHQSALI